MTYVSNKLIRDCDTQCFGDIVRLAEEKDIDDVEIDSKSLAALTAAFEQQQGTALKPGYELFNGEFDYGVLDCVRASLKSYLV